MKAKTDSICELHTGQKSLLIWGINEEKYHDILLLLDLQSNILTSLPTPPFRVGSQVYGYGGGAVACGTDEIFVVSYKGGELWSYSASRWRPITQRTDEMLGDLHFASGKVFAVAEAQIHKHEESHSLVMIEPTTGKVTTLREGADFYASPRVSPDGSRICWIEWNHPELPFTSTDLYTANLGSDGTLKQITKITGDYAQAITQPAWSPDGELHWISDHAGFWQIYSETKGRITSSACDYCRAPWKLGSRSYTFLHGEELVAAKVENGLWKLVRIDPKGHEQMIPLPFTEVDFVTCVEDELFAVLAEPNLPARVFSISTKDGNYQPVGMEVTVPKPNTSIDTLEFRTKHQERIGALLFTRPELRNDAPLIILCHGGPNSMAKSSYDLRKDYLIKNGFRVLDLNYRGSSGYGRKFRMSLDGHWGKYDVDDVLTAARYLIEQRLVSPNALFITGTSSGGFTALASITQSTLFAGCVSYYGISDLTTLSADTHKLERFYLDRLIGIDLEILRERSPLFQLNKIQTPILFLQGECDRIVPASQSIRMHQELCRRGIRSKYVELAGEGHGFSNINNQIAALKAELEFYNDCLIAKVT